jgi:predicted DNA-binding transcriptional regulator AlpA
MNREQVIPQGRLLRLRDVLALYPVSRTSWYDGITTGQYPPPVRLGKRTVAWRQSDIEAAIRGLNKGTPPSIRSKAPERPCNERAADDVDL